MTLEEKTTHVDEALDGLAQQFRGKPNIEGYLALIVRQVQDVETALISIFVKMAKPYAQGVQLDVLGRLVGEPRGSRDDTEYSTAIDARVLLNNSHGRIEDLISLARAVLGDVRVEIIESRPAEFEAIIRDEVTPDPPAWTPSTPYAVGDKASNFGNAYVVVFGGTSAASGGPSGTGANIADNDVRWNYYQPGIGERAARFVLAGKPAGVRGVFWWYETATPFGFAGNPGAFGFGTGALAGAIDLT